MKFKGMDMTGKTVLMTGATDGLGRVAARELARLGADLHLVARHRKKGEETAEAIRRTTGNRRVSLMLADLSSQAQVRALARQARTQLSRLDVLINNAGALYRTRRESEDGSELTWATNHLGPFLLTRLLLDKVTESAPARIVFTSSSVHRRGPIDFDDLEGRRRYAMMKAYGQSKLANLMVARTLAQRLDGAGVAVSTFHPGFVATNLASGMGPVLRTLGKVVMKAGGLPPEKGAETLVWLAAAPEAAEARGGYYVDCRPETPAAHALDAAAAERLWRLSEQQTGLAS